MNDLKHNTDFQTRFEERLIMILAVAIGAAMAIIAVGTAALPAVAAYLFSCPWLLLFYPGVFLACIIGAGKKR